MGGEVISHGGLEKVVRGRGENVAVEEVKSEVIIRWRADPCLQ